MSTRSVRYSTFNRSIRKGNLASTDRDALAFLEAAQIYNTNQQRAIVNLVRSLKRVELWSKMKAIYPFIGGTATSHKWNLKDPRDVDAAFRLTFSGGWTHSANGADPNGTNGYANTFLQTVTLQQNSAHYTVYSRENNQGLYIDIGSVDNSAPNYSSSALFIRYNGDIYGSIIQSNAVSGFQTSISDSLGLFIASRTSSNLVSYYKNNSSIGTQNSASTPPNNYSFYLSARNLQGSAATYSNRQIAFATIGDGLTDTDATNLYNIVDLYQKRLGRAV